MTEPESHATRIALLEREATIRDQSWEAKHASLRADIDKLKLRREESSAQRDRNIRYLAYALIASIVTNIAGPEAAIGLLNTIIGGK